MNMTNDSGRPLRILHIDDSRRDAEIIRELLIDNGLSMQLDWAANEQEFTSLLRSGSYDLVLADYRMPGFDGRAALRLVRSICPDTPFICVSGTIGEEAAVELLKQGAVDYVIKDRLERLPLAIMRAFDEAKEKDARKKSDYELQKSFERHQAILQTAMDGILRADTRGHLIEVNESYCQMSGYSSRELLTMSIPDIEANETADETADHIKKVIALGESRFESRHRRKDGTVFDVEVSVQSRPSEGGQMIAFIRDISERKRAEKERAETHLSLIQQDKMASIGQLAAGVAHEINNPIGFIRSNLDTLDKHIDKLTRYLSIVEELAAVESGSAIGDRLTEERSRLHIDFVRRDIGLLLKECSDGAERIIKIVRDMSVFTHHDAVKNMLLDINDCCETVISIIWNKIRFMATLKREYGQIPPVLCNSQQISQVLMNLMINAAQAIEEHGEITIRSWASDDSVFLSISDTGCGIAPEHIHHIFEAFYTTKEVGVGTGLGLSISLDIIKQHGGDITVESELGRGSRFTVRLPLEPAQ